MQNVSFHLFHSFNTHTTPPHAILSTDNEASRLTKIDGVGVVAGSSSVPSTYAPDTVKQHPQGTVTIA